MHLVIGSPHLANHHDHYDDYHHDDGHLHYHDHHDTTKYWSLALVSLILSKRLNDYHDQNTSDDKTELTQLCRNGSSGFIHKLSSVLAELLNVLAEPLNGATLANSH